MPRTLTRLRYREPPKPIYFSRQQRSVNPNLPPHWRPEKTYDEHLESLERTVAAHVIRQSSPSHFKISTTVDSKSRRHSPNKTFALPNRPSTLRDLVDPEGKAQHGEIIYVFRNIKTNQIIYSFVELLTEHHLEQLPFIGKKSKPSELRRDLWAPHCVVTFPTAAQGHYAFRKLREWRRLHETAWDKTNPEWLKIQKENRIKKIMDQRGNMAADLAAVLRGQETDGAKMMQALEEQQRKATKYMDNKWLEIDDLAAAAATKEKNADNVKWLEHQIRSLDMKLKMKHNQNEADQQRLKNAKNIQEIRLRKIQYALRKVEQMKNIQDELTQKAAPAGEVGADGKLDEMRRQAEGLTEAIRNPDPERSAKEAADDVEILASLQRDIKTLEEAFEAKSQLDNRDHHIARSVLPPKLKNPLPTPFSVADVKIRWADVQDALYARGQWPEIIEHDVLDIHKSRNETALLSKEEYDYQLSGEVSSIFEALKAKREAADETRLVRGAEKFSSVEKQSSVLEMLSQDKNVFKSATA